MFRPTPEPLAELLSASHPVSTRVECWRGGVFQGVAPLLSGELTENADQFVSGTLDLEIAATDSEGRNWIPRAPEDALNVYGSQVYVAYSVGRASGTPITVGLGWFVVDEWEESGGVISVSALDVRDQLRTARLLAPTAPASGGWFGTELRRLIGGRLPLDMSQAPTDRRVPSGMAWDEDRAEAIEELLTAWPARLELDPDGVLIVLPADLASQPADVQLVEGQGGTVVQRSSSATREGLYNVVVARGEDTENTDAPPVTGYAAVENPSSPLFVRGPMGEVVTFFASPLLRTVDQATVAANTLLAKGQRVASSVPVAVLPDPRLGINTRIDLALATGETLRTTVLSSSLPLTGEGGAQSLTLGVIPNA